MKFLKELDNDEIVGMMDVVTMSMLYYNQIKMKHIQEDRKVIKNLAVALVAIAAQNSTVKRKKDAALMGVSEGELVKKVERNGKVFGVIEGGRAE